MATVEMGRWSNTSGARQGFHALARSRGSHEQADDTTEHPQPGRANLDLKMQRRELLVIAGSGGVAADGRYWPGAGDSGCLLRSDPSGRSIPALRAPGGNVADGARGITRAGNTAGYFFL